ncbi:MAG: AbrB/MazE/SpoVT family DNA-binding domain-containing protein [Treponema sp.]
MELAKITSKGQITIPLIIRKSLRLQTGDKVFFEETNGKIYMTNASQTALTAAQEQMRGKADEAGFATEDDLTAYIKEMRTSR